MTTSLTFNQSNNGKTITATDGSSWGSGDNPNLSNITRVQIDIEYNDTTYSNVVDETTTDWAGDYPLQSELVWEIDVDTDATFGAAAFDGNDVLDDAVYTFTYKVTVDPEGIGVLTGSGATTMAIGGTYSGSGATTYKVQIDAEGSPDTFRWSDDGGSTWDASGVAITGAAQTLNNGVTVTFSATDTATLYDYWDFTATDETVDNTGFDVLFYYTVKYSVYNKFRQQPYKFTY